MSGEVVVEIRTDDPAIGCAGYQVALQGPLTRWCRGQCGDYVAESVRQHGGRDGANSLEWPIETQPMRLRGESGS